jgi:hypothetical protein
MFGADVRGEIVLASHIMEAFENSDFIPGIVIANSH